MTYVQPGLVVVLAALVFGLLARRSERARRAGSWALWMSLFGLAVWSSPPAARLALWTLERGYAPIATPADAVEAIVVFGGGVDPPYPSQPEPVAADSTYRRALYAAWLYRQGQPVPIIVSGGPADETAPETTVAEVAARILNGAGVPAERIIQEPRARSTYENAAYVAEILRRRGIRRVALVTDGSHMRRSEAALRRHGIEVLPAPCSLRSRRPFPHWRHYLPSGEAILDNEDCLHEWVALIWYRLRGWI
jgi:uncharacterized SAM-binding protein YcdF (DUF218 family)